MLRIYIYLCLVHWVNGSRRAGDDIEEVSHLGSLTLHQNSHGSSQVQATTQIGILPLKFAKNNEKKEETSHITFFERLLLYGGFPVARGLP